jgi:glutamate synthase (NADPH/NADH) small chain
MPQDELGEPDESETSAGVPMKGSEFVSDVDTVVVAIGAGANPLVQSTTPGLNTEQVELHRSRRRD